MKNSSVDTYCSLNRNNSFNSTCPDLESPVHHLGTKCNNVSEKKKIIKLTHFEKAKQLLYTLLILRMLLGWLFSVYMQSCKEILSSSSCWIQLFRNKTHSAQYCIQLVGLYFLTLHTILRQQKHIHVQKIIFRDSWCDMIFIQPDVVFSICLPVHVEKKRERERKKTQNTNILSQIQGGPGNITIPRFIVTLLSSQLESSASVCCHSRETGWCPCRQISVCIQQVLQILIHSHSKTLNTKMF